MMKKIIVLLIMIFITAAMPLSVYAQEIDVEEIYEEQLEASGALELAESLPDNTREILREMEIDPENGADWSIENLFDVIKKMIGDSIAETAGMFGMLLALIIMSSVTGRLAECSGSSTTPKVVQIIITAGVSIAAATPIAEYIAEAASAVETCCGFDMVFIPVYSVIAAASGKAVSASKYSVIMMSVLEMVSVAVNTVVLPLLRGILAVALTSSLAPTIKFSSVIALLEKYMKWILGFMAVLVVGVMGLGVIASGAMDEITAKTARFVISSTVPLVGSAMSDALSSVAGCVSLLRTSVGGFGMIAMAFILLPPLIKGTLWNLCFNFCAIAADMLDVKVVKNLMQSISGVLSVMTAVLVFTGVLTIFTLAVMLGRGA